MNTESFGIGPNASGDELITCFLARWFNDGDRVGIASNVPVVANAALLAHRLGRPNMRLLIGLSIQNFTGREPPQIFPDVVDFRNTYGAEAYTRHYENLEAIRKRANVFVSGALQVDPFGNSNLIGLSDPQGALRFRGPGALATTTMCDEVDRWCLYMGRHDREAFVDSCDFISCVGHGSGGARGRSQLGLKGTGPSFVLSPFGVLDFPPPARRMRLLHLQPGYSIRHVTEETGFELVIDDPTPIPPPLEAELVMLRSIMVTSVDGVRRDRPGVGLEQSLYLASEFETLQ